MKFYSLDKINKFNADYNVIFGERGNGKTTACLMKILKNWIDSGFKNQGAYIRRYDDEIIGNLGAQVYAAISDELDLVNKWTNGQWTGIKYSRRRWYLVKYDEVLDKYITQDKPFCFAFAINTAEKYKSTAYPHVHTIVFDECITRKPYIINEFTEFLNLISTIIRQRDGVKIYLLGNTVNKQCPYFTSMGLYKASSMEQDTIDLYSSTKTNPDGTIVETKTAVEYCGNNLNENGKKSDKYFNFDDPKLKMITTGAWETPKYPRLKFKVKNKNILDHFLIYYNDRILQGDIICQDDTLFIYIFKKYEPVFNDDYDPKIVEVPVFFNDKKQTYSLEFSPKYNYNICPIKHHRNRVSAKIGDLILKNLVFYENDEVGDLLRSFIMESSKVNSVNI